MCIRDSSKAGRPAKINRRPKTYAQSVCNSSSEVSDRSLTTGSDSFQPQTSSTPKVRKWLIDYLSPRTVVNQSNTSDNNCLPGSDTRPLLHTSTPKQQTPSSTDTLTPTIVPHFIKTGHKTQSTTFTELDKTETAKKDFKKRWNQN